MFVQDLADLGLNTDTLAALVDATGGAGQHGVPWTYSDIRSRLYPAALAQAYPDNGLTAEHLLQVALTLKPSPVLEDDA